MSALTADQVSALIVVHDGARYLPEAIDSILGQSTPPGEIVVVDDGSTDRTPEVLASYAAHVVVDSPGRVGQAAARNRAVTVAGGILFAFLDADDLWTPTSLESRVERLNDADEPDVVVGCTEQFASDDLDEAARARYRIDATPMRGELFQATIIRRSAWDQVGPLADVSTVATIDWISRARAAGLRFAEIPDVVVRRRIHDANESIRHTEQKNKDLLHVVRAHRRRFRPPLG